MLILEIYDNVLFACDYYAFILSGGFLMYFNVVFIIISGEWLRKCLFDVLVDDNYK